MKWLLWSLFVCGFLGHHASAACVGRHLEISAQPGNGTGGLPLPIQPEVRVVDWDGDLCPEYGVETELTATLADFSYGTLSGDTTVTFLGGVATFTDLTVDLIGDYRFNLAMALEFIESDYFTISVGPASRIEVSTQPGTSLGGSPFRPQPVVAVVDAGGNCVETENSVYISVEMLANPAGGTLSSSRPMTVLTLAGKSFFTDLSIDKAGQPYSLRFTTDAALDVTTVDSIGFTVGIGPTASIEVLQQPAGVRGGIIFETQPIVALKDLGGNIRVDDFWSVVTVSIFNNPSRGTLSPTWLLETLAGTVSVTQGEERVFTTDHLEGSLLPGNTVRFGEYQDIYIIAAISPTADGAPYWILLSQPYEGEDETGLDCIHLTSGLSRPVDAGLMEYTLLEIDHIGEDYSLKFTLQNDEDIWVLSDRFNIPLGDPTLLLTITPIDEAWAGGQPFKQQPKVGIFDAGGNLMTTDNINRITAQLYTNPPNAVLLGEDTFTVVEGAAQFLDLRIDKSSPDYVMKYWTSAGHFILLEPFEVVYSHEFQVYPENLDKLDQFGWSVDLDADSMTIASGAPNKTGQGTYRYPVHWPYEEAPRAETGPMTGSVSVFGLDADGIWEAKVSVVPSETDELDQFGWSVAVEGTTLVAGAPAAVEYGEAEQQTISCVGDGGYFTLSHAGYSTAALTVGDSLLRLKTQLQLLPEFVLVSVTGPDTLCGDPATPTVHTVVFRLPQVGDHPDLGKDDSALTSTTLGAGSITIVETVKGTSRILTDPDWYAQAGAVYVFCRSSTAVHDWTETVKIIAADREAGDDFGHAVSLDGDRLAIGAPGHHFDGTPDKSGAVYVYTRTAGSCSNSWTIEASLHTLVPHEGAFLGCSVALEGNTIAAGAYGDFDGQGRVYIFKYVNGAWSQIEFLHWPEEGQLHAGDQFGWSVALHANTVVIGTPGRTVNGVDRCGSAYAFYRGTEASDFFPQDELAASHAKAHDRVGLSVAVYGDNALVGSLAIADLDLVFKELTPADALTDRYDMERYHSFEMVRGYVTAHSRSGTAWTEQAVVRPEAFQPADLYGHSVAISEMLAVVGVPNRDPTYNGNHGGAVFVYDLGFLNIAFQSATYSIGEEETALTVTILNTDTTMEGHIQYTTSNGSDQLPYLNTVTIVNPATSIETCALGSGDTPHCRFFPSDDDVTELSTYDIHGVGDFAPASGSLDWIVTESAKTVDIDITNDDRFESPDETFFVKLFSPGIQPSIGGNMWTAVTIEDDGDGGIGVDGYMEKLFPTTAEPFGKFGVAVAADGDTVAVGHPYSAAEKGDETVVPRAGSVEVFVSEDGLWSREALLVPPDADIATAMKFGGAVAISADTIVVGSERSKKAFVFQRTDETWSWAASLEPCTLPSGEDIRVHSTDRFGGPNAVAIDEDFIVVGAAGVETVFVYRREAGVWGDCRALRSSDYYDTVVDNRPYQMHADFGASVSLSNRTIAVGAPYAHPNIPEEERTLESIGDVNLMRESELGWGSGAVYIFFLRDVADWTTWEEHDRLVPFGGDAIGDQFGVSVDLEGDQLIVGGPKSQAHPNITWDFESGTLQGWKTTGTAFNNQPTYFDNSVHREEYHNFFGGRREESARQSGRFWIGTFEDRPGNLSNLDPLNTYEPSTPAGNSQGDLPRGTLTSLPFVINGTEISFLVGGGCTIKEQYVELVVNGIPTLRATGTCTETMQRTYWDVSDYIGSVGQIRVVDASSLGWWAHINFDDVRFDWDVEHPEQSQAGAAWTFLRTNETQLELCACTCYATGCDCSPEKWGCIWINQERFQPSDLRTGDKCGTSVAIDEAENIGFVGCPYHRAVDQFNLDYKTWEGTPDGVGAVFLYKRTPVQRDPLGRMVALPTWESHYEHAKMQPIQKLPRENFGYAVSASAHRLFAGAPQDSRVAEYAGSVHIMDTRIHKVTFLKAETVAAETAGVVVVRLLREWDDSISEPLTVAYGLTDLTAISVTSEHFDECVGLAMEKRIGCGDYEQSAGEVTFLPEEVAAEFEVRIVTDLVDEKDIEFAYMQLMIPGGDALVGTAFNARLRIDDDDHIA